MLHLEHIEALLEKYWEGDTTLEEERLLKTYFASSEVADSLRQYAPLFQVFREEQSVQFSKKATATVIKPVQYNWKPWAVAASVALLMSAGWWWSVQPGPTNEYVAETNPKPCTNHPGKASDPCRKPSVACSHRSGFDSDPQEKTVWQTTGHNTIKRRRRNSNSGNKSCPGPGFFQTAKRPPGSR
ncbi:MAG: hypothetical protein IPL27_21650 [Lewinellaceae bacterium]|nr:hypothetical protein [Lewinellaceae bacterium]